MLISHLAIYAHSSKKSKDLSRLSRVLFRPGLFALLLVTTISWAAPQGNAVSERSRDVEDQVSIQSNSSGRGTEKLPIFVKSVADSEDAANAKAREAKSDKHDAEDLIAQIRTADAAEKQVQIGWAAVILSALGTVGVICSLVFSSKGVREAARAAEATRDSVNAFRLAQRPWINYSHIETEPFTDGIMPNGQMASGYNFRMVWKNYGANPSVRCKLYFAAQAFPADAPNHIFDMEAFIKASRSPSVLFTPGQEMKSSVIPFLQSHADQLYKRAIKFFVYGRAIYETGIENLEGNTEVCFSLEIDGFEARTKSPNLVWSPVNSQNNRAS